jgi:hypothetical protein
VLGDDLHVPMLEPPVFGLVFDAKVRQRDVTANERKVVGLGELSPIAVERLVVSLRRSPGS